jgi:hypothetical protein
MGKVMNHPFQNPRHSELRAALTVVAVLAIGMMAKLDAAIQLFHNSH